MSRKTKQDCGILQLQHVALTDWVESRAPYIYEKYAPHQLKYKSNELFSVPALG